MNWQAWIDWVKHWMTQQGWMKTPTEIAIDELLRQQQKLIKEALAAYIEERHEDWERINAESERISRQIATIEHGRLLEETETE